METVPSSTNGAPSRKGHLDLERSSGLSGGTASRCHEPEGKLGEKICLLTLPFCVLWRSLEELPQKRREDPMAQCPTAPGAEGRTLRAQGCFLAQGEVRSISYTDCSQIRLRAIAHRARRWHWSRHRLSVSQRLAPGSAIADVVTRTDLTHTFAPTPVRRGD